MTTARRHALKTTRTASAQGRVNVFQEELKEESASVVQDSWVVIVHSRVTKIHWVASVVDPTEVSVRKKATRARRCANVRKALWAKSVVSSAHEKRMEACVPTREPVSWMPIRKRRSVSARKASLATTVK